MDNGILLKTILDELKDGVIVCDPEARITLFNPAAKDLFDRSRLLHKDESLYSMFYQPTVEQALRLLHYQHDLDHGSKPLPFIQFINKTVGRNRYFRCRVNFLAAPVDKKKSFVLVFEDISAWYSPENPLLRKIEEFRAPMTNLRAAVENLTEYPEMSPVMRTAFENVLVQETVNLSETFNGLARSCNMLMQTQNHLAELSTEVLFGFVTHHLNSKKIPVASAPARNINVNVDIYGLLLLLDFLADNVLHKQPELSGEFHVGEQFIFMDFIWTGEVIVTGTVKSLLNKNLEQGSTDFTVAAILHVMDGDIWSQQQDKNKSMLRLALPVVIGAGK